MTDELTDYGLFVAFELVSGSVCRLCEFRNRRGAVEEAVAGKAIGS